MSGLDALFANTLEKVIRENLGEKSTRSIEKRLFEKYGITMIKAIEDFQKLDAILREYFGEGADGIEKKCLEGICKIKSKSKTGNWYTIEDDSISQVIVEAYGDDDKAKIMNVVYDESKIISDILTKTKIPQTSAYRKINALIGNGLLVADGSLQSHDGRKITKYRSLFDNIRINIIKNKISVDVQLNRPQFNGSTILQIIYGS